MNTTTYRALTIAGSDSGGGAGIQADLKTFSAIGVYGTSAITAVTAQNTRAVTHIEPLSPVAIRAQIEAVFDDIRPHAVKIGMLGDVATIETVANSLTPYADSVPIVLDPVMIAKSGDALLLTEAVTALKTKLIPLATLITPNLPEAAVLLNRDAVLNSDDDTARELLTLGAKAVLLKGGHSQSDTIIDTLATIHSIHHFKHQRVHTNNTHGTGCTLSAAITAGLAAGLPLEQAVRHATHYIHDAISYADQLNIGNGLGHGPVHHFYRWWQA